MPSPGTAQALSVQTMVGMSRMAQNAAALSPSHMLYIAQVSYGTDILLQSRKKTIQSNA